MTREEAKRFWLIRYENAKDFSDPHWEAQERREHREYVEALRMAIEALQDEAPKPTGELIARADAIEAVMAEGHKVYTSEYASAERVIYEADAVEALSMLPSSEAVQGWIPFKTRPLTDEEKQEFPEWTYIFDCPLPDDGEEILLSNGKYVWTDTFINDGECYLDGGDDIDDGMAWMPLSKPCDQI